MILVAEILKMETYLYDIDSSIQIDNILVSYWPVICKITRIFFTTWKLCSNITNANEGVFIKLYNYVVRGHRQHGTVT